MRFPSRPSRRAVAASAVGLAATALIAAELAVPSLAERRVRDHASAIAPVRAVEIHSRPALKALWGDVDGVEVRLGDGEIDPERVRKDGLLDRLRDVDDVRASAGSLRAGPLAADDVRVVKDGRHLTARFAVDLATLRTALPGAQLRPSGAPDGLVVDVKAPQLPIPGGLRMRVAARDGALVAEPQGGAAAMIGPQKLMGNDDLTVERLSSRVDGERIRLEVRGRV